ncbi:MAG TPA: glycosyltransferase family 4 protein [Acidimicrobiales bacterium]|jgi:glycosyltransferase involved in cell wall biosynthesis|nr:glycosyltransferase family 4 protein [Acidimicrobiales bacterium]
MPDAGPPLRIALLTYRGNPQSGGQGVYTHYLSRELAALGHSVTVFSGPPYPDLAPGVELVRVPSLDLYRPDDPFRTPHRSELCDLVDVAEWAIMCTAGFPEPLTFSIRVRRLLRRRQDGFDVVHDNQCLGYGILGLVRDGFPLVATLHHPITIDRALDLASAPTWQRRATLRRWYGFLRMQKRVVRRLPRLLTVSESSARDACREMGARRDRVAVVPVGVDTALFHPLPAVARVPGRLVTTASADVPMKGLLPLLEALAKVRTERHAELVIVGRPRGDSLVPATIERLGLEGAVTLAGVVPAERLVELYAEAEVAVVPSLYEGFSLPAIEAMACGVPLVSTTGGALPEVVGRHGDTALLVPPGDPGELAAALVRALDDHRLRARMGEAGRRRVLERFSWRATADATVEQYRAAIAAATGAPPGASQR